MNRWTDSLPLLGRLQRLDQLLQALSHGLLVLEKPVELSPCFGPVFLGSTRCRQIGLELVVVVLEGLEPGEKLLDFSFQRVEDLRVVHRSPIPVILRAEGPPLSL